MRYVGMKLTTAVAAVAALGLLRAQAPAKADAEYLRAAYETFRRCRACPPASTGSFSARRTSAAVPPILRLRTRTARADLRRLRHERRLEDGRQRRDLAGRLPEPGVTSIGDLAVAPSVPDIVWVGTGEANLFRASMPGVGIYKSVDGGKRSRTWGSPTPRRSRASSSIQPIRTSSTSRPWGTSGPTTRRAASPRRPTRQDLAALSASARGPVR